MIEDFDPARLRQIVDVVADGITVQALDGRIVYANDAAARACGFETADELLAAGRAAILARFELLDEDAGPLDPRSLPGARVLRGEPSSDVVVGFRIRATGEERWSIVSAVPLRDGAGRVEFAINAFHDITGRKQAEDERDRERTRLAATLSQRLADEARLAELIRSERARSAELNAIIGAIGEGIVVVDRDGVITLANRTARRMLGPFEEADLDALLARFDRAAELRARLGTGPVQARLAGEAGRWLEVAAYPVEDSPALDPQSRTGEGSGGAILVIRDVTAARERDQARDAFIGMLSHELRTPITTIYAGAKLLSRGGGLEEDTRASIFEDIHGEAERLHRLVEDVVALTRFGEGALDIGSEPVLLQRVLPAVVRSEEGRWPGGRFELAFVPGSAARLRRRDLRGAGGAQPPGQRDEVRRPRRRGDDHGHRGRRRGPGPRARQRPGLPGGGRRAPVPAVLPLAGARPDRQRLRDRAVRLLAPHRRDGRPRLGAEPARGRVRSSGSPSGRWPRSADRPTGVSRVSAGLRRAGAAMARGCDGREGPVLSAVADEQGGRDGAQREAGLEDAHRADREPGRDRHGPGRRLRREVAARAQTAGEAALDDGLQAHAGHSFNRVEDRRERCCP